MNLLIFTLSLLPALAFSQDKTEIQWAICEISAHQLIQKSALKFSSTKSFRQTYFDTSDTYYHLHGISLHQKKNSEENSTKLKITFFPGQKIDRAWIKENGGECEYDSYGKNNLLRCEIENVDGEDLWSEEQREFLRRHQQADFTSRLETWGPYLVKNWEVKTKEWGKLKINDLSLGKSKSIIELSAKTSPDRAETLRKNIEQWMREKKNHSLCRSGGKVSAHPGCCFEIQINNAPRKLKWCRKVRAILSPVSLCPHSLSPSQHPLSCK